MPTEAGDTASSGGIRAVGAVATLDADWLVGGGEMGTFIRAMDWSSTPLGPLPTWPQSLRTTVSLCLASNFPISIAWGPHHIQIYNDGYWPICAAKHPTSMGQDFSECWASAWPAIGEAFERALRGEASFLENVRMFLDRNGYLEETFFTFSFSPIRDETNQVGGLFHPVTEVTPRMLNERGTRALRDLAARAGKARTTSDALQTAAQVLAGSELDLPFVLFYEIHHGEARLVASCGVGPDVPAAPALMMLGTAAEMWSISAVVQTGQTQQLDEVAARFAAHTCGPYPEPPHTVLTLPVTPAGCDTPVAAIVAGVSPRLPLNDSYRAFFDLMASGVTSAVSNALAYEAERRRAEALAELDRAKTTFFSNISHEFRTPLTLMLGPLEDELAAATTHSPDSRARLETAHRNSVRLLKLVNALLDFSRIEAGRIQASYEPTDLAALTGDLASMFRSAFEKAGLSFDIECPPLPEPVYVDREMWEKVVLNLLSNALKHTFEGGARLSQVWRGGHVELAVADTGIGIAASELPRLFDRFHRIKGARSRSHEGTGIGLALVQELVGLHRGTVQVASVEGQGTTFTVGLQAGYEHLPAESRLQTERPHQVTSARATAYVQEALQWLPADREAPAHDDAPLAAGGSAMAGGVRSRILWADDNADLRSYVSRLLDPYYDVEAVMDGAAALAAARRQVPDLVLSDVMMPRLDGFGLLRELRADQATRAVPVILLSARAGEEASIEGLHAGADDYLVKPFSARELLARVRTHLELAHVRKAWADELERANKELEAFSCSVSHDLRTPLRAIDGFMAVLERRYHHLLDDEGQRYFGRVRDASVRMGELIDDLLSLSRLSRLPVSRERVDLTAASESVLAALAQADPHRQVAAHVQPGLTVTADRRLLAIVLENLLGNAWKFTGRTADARVEFGRTGDATPTFFVRDNGAGFEMQYVNKLFLPFQRLHRASEFDGTGIGLATVQRAIGRHGGRIWAEARPGAGATFFFTLETAK